MIFMSCVNAELVNTARIDAERNIEKQEAFIKIFLIWKKHANFLKDCKNG